jgi:hypothetical protein
MLDKLRPEKLQFTKVQFSKSLSRDCTFVKSIFLNT